MAGLGISAGPGAFLLGAALYFVGGGAALAAFVTAALAHELGHLAALGIAGAELRRVRFTAAGPVLEYSGPVSRRQEAGVVAAGPLAGILFAVICFAAGTPYYHYVGAIALLSSMFNLLPVLPMDGGRLARLLLETVMPSRTTEAVLRVTGSLCALGVFLTGLRLRSPAAAAAGVWMGALANISGLR